MDRNGYIWLPTIGFYIFRFDPNEERWDPNYNNEDDIMQNIYEVARPPEEDDDGSVWFAGYYGLFRYKDSSEEVLFDFYNEEDGIPSYGLRGLDIDSDNAVWIGSFGGLVRYKEGEGWKRFTKEKNNLTNYFVLDVFCDKQDRILIPMSLRQLAGLEKEIAIVGVLKYFEIWSREKWEKEYMNLEHDMQQEEVRNEIAKLGI